MSLSIEELLQPGDVEYKFIHGSGPGGQNVNKVATAVQLRFNVARSGLPDYMKARVLEILSSRLTKAGDLLIDARTHRTQKRNKDAAFRRLITLLEAALIVREIRIPTQPNKAKKEKRLVQKKQRATLKKYRKPISPHQHDEG